MNTENVQIVAVNGIQIKIKESQQIMVVNGRPTIIEKKDLYKYLDPIIDNAKRVQKKRKKEEIKQAEIKDDYIYSNQIIDRFSKHLSKSEQWGLFTDLFSAFPINPEIVQDYRVIFLIRWIDKIRHGIKVKFNATKIDGTNKGLGKSRGYNTQRFDKNHQTAKDAFQIAYYNCLLKGRRITPIICILSALHEMKREKKMNKKVDFIGWKKYRGQVFDSIHSAKIEDKKESMKSDKLEMLKTKLSDFLPSNKADKQWATIWTLYLCQGFSRKQIRHELNISKSYLNKTMRKIPSEFTEYKTELLNCCSVYYRK